VAKQVAEHRHASDGQRIGLIAGNGRFPIIFADNAKRLGYSVTAVAHEGETDPGTRAACRSHPLDQDRPVRQVDRGAQGRRRAARSHAGRYQEDAHIFPRSALTFAPWLWPRN
jgi:hypothetical protein